MGTEELIEHHKSQCDRYVSGRCHTQRCLVLGGYERDVTPLPVDPDSATCEARETVLLLQQICPACDGSGVETFATTVYEHGCGFSHESSDERPCASCGGSGRHQPRERATRPLALLYDDIAF